MVIPKVAGPTICKSAGELLTIRGEATPHALILKRDRNNNKNSDFLKTFIIKTAN
jgi:hypothetical protein